MDSIVVLGVRQYAKMRKQVKVINIEKITININSILVSFYCGDG